ncbi:MAG: hypothetical protein NC390_03490 [Fusobacterium sp.]|nr:hypothetical protein [Fusobacterium sp.]
MKKIIAVLLLCLLTHTQAYAAYIPQGTAVIVQPQREIDADDVKIGNTVKFSVVQPVKVNKQVIIKSGTEVTAQIIRKKNNFILGIPGELELGNFQIYNSDSNIINLRGNIIDKGEGKYWAHIGWFFLFPILFVKGNDAKIPVNIQHTLYTLEDVNIDL